MAFTTRRAFLAGLALTAGSFALAGCSSNGGGTDEAQTSPKANSDKTITVAASPTPHAEILNGPVKTLLEEQGYTLDVKEFTDYVLPNTVTEDGEVDANYFQHGPYLEKFNEEKGTHLVAAASIHFEPFALYPGRTGSLDELEEGSIVAVPNDTTNEARALLLLEQEGLLTLAEDAGIAATVKDIVDNPLNLEFKELEAAAISAVLPDVDIACINGNYALDAGFSLDDALALEADDSLAAETYANVLAVREGNETSEKTKALVAALTSDETRAFINDTFKGAVVAVF